MFDSPQQWELFGYDMRLLGRHWLGAWRSLLWSDESPLRRRLDEVVRVTSEERSYLIQADRELTGAPAHVEAVLLPEELVLSRRLSLPAAVEGELASAVALEVSANCPFAADDTAYGWRVTARDEQQLQLALAMVSRSAVMGYLGKRYALHDPREREVWADVEDAAVVLRGFGEVLREGAYRRRLLRCGALLATSALLLLLIAGAAAGFQRLRLQQLAEQAETVSRDAATATALRESMAAANQRIAAVDQLVAAYPSPHEELARLTGLLGDDVYLLQFTMSGRQISLRGRAADAASVMQQLADQPAYADVSAPQAIMKVGETGLEQFALDIDLATEVAP